MTTESAMTGKSSTAKSKKKVKQLPDKEATSDTVDVGFKNVEPPPYPFSPREIEVRK